MRKYVFVTIFIIGLGVFSYPIVSNMFSTKVHQSVVKEYNETIEQLDKEDLMKQKEKVDKHNKELSESDLNFVDPFAEDKKDDELGTKSYYNALNIGPAIGSVEIPTLNVELPIYHGTSDDVLSQGVGHLENSSLPSTELGTHSVITAHRGLPSSKLFRDLDKMKIGDTFFVQVLDETIAYEVESIDIVLPSETEWLTMEEDENKMTLLTCDPYMINTHRMLVTGHQIPYNPEVKPKKTKDYSDYYLLAGVLLVLIILIIYLTRKKRKQGEAS